MLSCRRTDTVSTARPYCLWVYRFLYCNAVAGQPAMLAEGVPSADVAAYALMAAGGDFGSSVGPQLVGIVTDLVMQSGAVSGFVQSSGLSPDQLGMKTGLLCGALFPVAGIGVSLVLARLAKHSSINT